MFIYGILFIYKVLISIGGLFIWCWVCWLFISCVLVEIERVDVWSKIVIFLFILIMWIFLNLNVVNKII